MLWAIQHFGGNLTPLGPKGGSIVDRGVLRKSTYDVRVDDELQPVLVQGEATIRDAGRLVRVLATRDGALVMPTLPVEQRVLRHFKGGPCRTDAVRAAWIEAVKTGKEKDLPEGLRDAARAARQRLLARCALRRNETAPKPPTKTGAERLSDKLKAIRAQRIAAQRRLELSRPPRS